MSISTYPEMDFLTVSGDSLGSPEDSRSIVGYKTMYNGIIYGEALPVGREDDLETLKRGAQYLTKCQVERAIRGE